MLKKEKALEFTLNNYKYLLLITALILTFVFIYKPHFDYKFPFHADEWTHLAYSTYIMQPHTDPNEFPALNVNPYFYATEKDFEVGFHVFLAAIFASIGVDPVLNFKFLPAVTAVIAAFILFVLIYRMSHNFYAGVLSVLFFTGLRTNVNILGIQFFVPLTATIPLVFCFLLLLSEGVTGQSWRKLSVAGGVLLSIFIIHPVTAMFLTPITAVYVLFSLRQVWHNKLGMFFLLLIPCFAFLAFFTFLWKGSVMATWANIATYLVFEKGKTLATEYFYFLPRYFNGTFFNNGLFFVNDMTWLVIIGAYVAFSKPKKRILGLWILVAFASCALFFKLNWTVLAQYQRVLYYGLLAMAPLAAVGLYSLFNLIMEPLSKFVFAEKKYITEILWFAFTLFFIIVISNHTYETFNYDNDYFYKIISWEEYNGILGLKINNITKATVFTWPGFGSAVTPITGNKVVEHTLQFNGQQPSYRFLRANCEEQRAMINTYGATHLLYQYEWNCPGYKKLYDNGVLKLYEV